MGLISRVSSRTYRFPRVFRLDRIKSGRIYETKMAEASDFQSVIQTALAQRSAVRGLKEGVRSVAAGQAEVVFLAGDVNNAEYKTLVEAICKESKVPLINVDSKEILGQWAGLAKIDEEGEVTKARACGCVSVRRIPAGPSGEKLKAFISTASS